MHLPFLFNLNIGPGCRSQSFDILSTLADDQANHMVRYPYLNFLRRTTRSISARARHAKPTPFHLLLSGSCLMRINKHCLNLLSCHCNRMFRTFKCHMRIIVIIRVRSKRCILNRSYSSNDYFCTSSFFKRFLICSFWTNQ